MDSDYVTGLNSALFKDPPPLNKRKAAPIHGPRMKEWSCCSYRRLKLEKGRGKWPGGPGEGEMNEIRNVTPPSTPLCKLCPYQREEGG